MQITHWNLCIMIIVISYGNCNTWKLDSSNDVRYSWEDGLLRPGLVLEYNCFNFHWNSPRNAYSSLPKPFATSDQIRFLVETPATHQYSLSLSPHLLFAAGHWGRGSGGHQASGPQGDHLAPEGQALLQVEGEILYPHGRLLPLL